LQKLANVNDSTITKTVQGIIQFLTGVESSNSMFDTINGTLRKLNKQLVVFVGDIDRLDKEEITEVMRLIRNTANFYNTVFIVAQFLRFNKVLELS